MLDHWTKIAHIRREQIESQKDITFHHVFLPELIKLFKNRKSQRVIEIGAGTGHLAQKLRPLVKHLTAIEPSLGMYEIAKTVLHSENVHLEHTDSFNHKTEDKYDCAYSHMCAHTIKNLEDFFLSISRNLKNKGDFIFSIPHPCFYHEYKDYFLDEYSYMTTRSKNINLIISLDKARIMPNIPYIHRPLSSYIDLLKKSGLLVKDFIETWPKKEIQDMYPEPWKSPRYCIFICQLAN